MRFFIVISEQIRMKKTKKEMKPEVSPVIVYVRQTLRSYQK